ncbi:hypothetical protein [Pseudanabaena sp. FACHB-2040]|uniref:hypothetical protein n=1 Tax=Pseudanabaena sp. FACHB-2040 TaxID=2692859 RepID=UPI001681F67D|nr:hypothetical protein [Pseudanabaena sp. FACHB-2040]MBD2261249.1 hypothetical protein [Pseudanabaena sp. FACHB-2040]
MGFLQWFRENQEDAASQLALPLGNGNELEPQAQHDYQAITQRKHIRDQYEATIQEKMGSGKLRQDPVLGQATEAMTREIFGCGVSDLYKETGSKPKQRNTLPPVAQNAYMVGESFATDALENSDIQGSKDQRRQQIVGKAADAGNRARKRMPW